MPVAAYRAVLRRAVSALRASVSGARGRRLVTAAVVIVGVGLLAAVTDAAKRSSSKGPPSKALAARVDARALGADRPGRAPGREIAHLRTRYSRTYREAGGQSVARISAAPVNYRDAGGRWQPIDDTLVPVAGGGHRNR